MPLCWLAITAAVLVPMLFFLVLLLKAPTGAQVGADVVAPGFLAAAPAAPAATPGFLATAPAGSATLPDASNATSGVGVSSLPAGYPVTAAPAQVITHIKEYNYHETIPAGEHYHTGASHLVIQYNCNEGLRSWRSDWSDGKKEWCCQRSSHHFCVGGAVAGYEAPPLPYDCLADTSSWRDTWSHHKKAWCCLHESADYCAGHVYDCSGPENQWSSTEKEWCRYHVAGYHKDNLAEYYYGHYPSHYTSSYESNRDRWYYGMSHKYPVDQNGWQAVASGAATPDEAEDESGATKGAKTEADEASEEVPDDSSPDEASDETALGDAVPEETMTAPAVPDAVADDTMSGQATPDETVMDPTMPDSTIADSAVLDGTVDAAVGDVTPDTDFAPPDDLPEGWLAGGGSGGDVGAVVEGPALPDGGAVANAGPSLDGPTLPPVDDTPEK